MQGPGTWKEDGRGSPESDPSRGGQGLRNSIGTGGKGVYTNSFIHKLCVSLFLVTFNFFTARGPQKYKNIIWFTVHVPSTRNRQMSLKSNRNMTLVVFDNFLMLWRSVSAFGGPGVK